MKKNGFTLVELMIAISIISVLTAIALVTYQDINKKSRDARRQSDLKVIQSALQQYFADQNYYPSNDIAQSTSLTYSYTENNQPKTKTYLNQMPVEPKTDNSRYMYIASPPGCTNSVDNYCASYCLFANLEGTPPSVSGCTPPNPTYNFYVTPN